MKSSRQQLLDDGVERSVVEPDAVLLAALAQGGGHFVGVHGPLVKEHEDGQGQGVGKRALGFRRHILCTVYLCQSTLYEYSGQRYFRAVRPRAECPEGGRCGPAGFSFRSVAAEEAGRHLARTLRVPGRVQRCYLQFGESSWTERFIRPQSGLLVRCFRGGI